MMDDTKIPLHLQPSPQRYAFDLDRTLRAVVGVHANAPEDAFTAAALGTTRAGNGVVIDADGLIATVAYLVTEAETIWLTRIDGTGVPGHVVGIDHWSGVALVQPLGRLGLPYLEIGEPEEMTLGDPAIFAAVGGRSHAAEVRVVAREGFAGYWEYYLETALFTAPAHPFWGGGGLIGIDGKLMGIGSLVVQHTDSERRRLDMNMVIPSSVIPPVLPALIRTGHSGYPPKPWVGLLCGENDGMVLVQNVMPGSPVEQAGVRPGDRIQAIGRTEISSLAGLWQAIWASGPPGSGIELSIMRGGRAFDVTVRSEDRERLLKAPRLQ